MRKAPHRRALLERTDDGLYCAAGDFYIDPWRPVKRALVTHAHADHARGGSAHYWAAATSLPFLHTRLGKETDIAAVEFGEALDFGPVRVSFHPAGHIRGSAQIRVEHAGEVWVVTGDFKREADPTAEAFEPVPCDTLVTEATFALPLYRWPDPREVAAKIAHWHHENAAEGMNSVLFCYALGKAQRLLALLKPHLDRTVYLHGALVGLTELYREAGIDLPPTVYVTEKRGAKKLTGALVLAPPSGAGSPWMRRLQPCRTAFASGWMTLRGVRRRRTLDRGFVLSDHTDWPDLLATIRESGARRVLATHGRSDVLVRYLREVEGIEAAALESPYGGEDESTRPPGGSTAEGDEAEHAPSG